MQMAGKTQRNCPEGGSSRDGSKDYKDFLPNIKLIG